MLRSLIAIALSIMTVSTQLPAQIVELKLDKLPGGFQIPDLSGGRRNFSPFQKDERSSDDKFGPFKPHDGTAVIKHPDLDLNVSGLRTIPFWSDTFDYHGLRYTYKMVGTDPNRGSATTVIPVTIIPIRWVFSNGMVVDASTDIVDGQTPVQGIVNSPIFQDYDFTLGGTHVGNTQYGDAFQRANFWNSVSTRSPNYHVRLGTPTIAATQTINVPADKVQYYTNPDNGEVFPTIDLNFVGSLDRGLIEGQNISPNTLPIIVWGQAAAGFALGYHGAYQTGNSIQTFMDVSYQSSTFPFGFPGYLADVSNLSHELTEWMDDPFIDNHSAGWNNPFFLIDFPPPVRSRCDSFFEGRDLLETADPFENLAGLQNTPVVSNGFTYHIAEGAFIDFFTRNVRSRSVNGQYSFFEFLEPYGFPTPPSHECLGSLLTENRFFTFPGSIFTYAYGMNDTGSIVGYYSDAAHRIHGFKKDATGYTSLDFPGASITAISDINNGGTMVGFYYDANGFPHGFSYKNGHFASINFPDAVDTVPEKINSAGMIVGVFNTTQPITRGFVLDATGYQAVDSPYGQQSEAAAINDLGTIAGNSWSAIPGPQSGFLKTRKGFTRFDFPDQTVTGLTSINTYGDLSGLLPDSGPFHTTGFVRLFGYPYVTYPYSLETVVVDVNDNREILGQAYNFEAQQLQPFIARPALASGN